MNRFYFIFLLVNLSFEAIAGCDPITTHKYVNIPSSISIPAGITLGKNISPVYGPFSGISTGLKCTYTPYLFLALGQTMPLSSFDNIYETNVPGVGVKLWSSYAKKTYVGNVPEYWYQSNTAYAGAYIENIYIQFYAISPLDAGVITLPQPLIQAMTSSSQSYVSTDSAVYNYMSVNHGVDFIIPTCTVDTASTNQTVNIPNSQISYFSGVGSTAESTPFAINLNCAANVSVYATITDANAQGNFGTSLTLDNDSTATGVGVQILVNASNTPLNFGANNQFYLVGNSSAAATSYHIPFLARYVQTEPNITAGSVGAKAIISFEYL